MSWELFTDVLRNSVLITGLVIIMMLMIEYFNIHSHGKWFLKLNGSKFRQILLGSLLGLIPGCIGGFAAVSLFTHNLISLGALSAMMISSSGDEAFIILALMPEEGLLLFLILFLIAIVTGVLVDYVFFKKPQKHLCPDKFEIHASDENNIPSIFKASSYRVMLHPSRERIIILLGIALFIGAVILGTLEHDHAHTGEGHMHSPAEITATVTESGHEPAHTVAGEHNHDAADGHSHDAAEEHVHGTADEHAHDATEEHTHTHDAADGHNHLSGFNILNERWINLVFAVISIITLFFTATAKEHFIKEHLWKHVIKKHLVSIFLWTFCTLLVCQIGLQYLDVEHWISKNMLLVILLAVAIGIIPESGPHMVFITLYVQGILPFYVLLINSMVQDGHTTLPLLAESKSAFLKAKTINIVMGLLVGIICWAFQNI